MKFSAPAKKAKNRPKIEKNSNLKVDRSPYSSTDRTHIYRVYHLGIPLSIPGIKKNSLEVAKKNKFNLKFSVQILKNFGTQKHRNTLIENTGNSKILCMHIRLAPTVHP